MTQLPPVMVFFPKFHVSKLFWTLLLFFSCTRGTSQRLLNLSLLFFLVFFFFSFFFSFSFPEVFCCVWKRLATSLALKEGSVLVLLPAKRMSICI